VRRPWRGGAEQAPALLAFSASIGLLALPRDPGLASLFFSCRRWMLLLQLPAISYFSAHSHASLCALGGRWAPCVHTSCTSTCNSFPQFFYMHFHIFHHLFILFFQERCFNHGLLRFLLGWT
jgi:hypothetical protein